MHRGEEFYALSKIGPYTFADYIVAARDNTKFCATVIEPTNTPWGEIKQSICVKHTMIIGRTTSGKFIGKDEAYLEERFLTMYANPARNYLAVR